MNPKVPNLAKKRFGRLVVLHRVKSDKLGNAMWECLCDCGSTKVVLGASLRGGNTKSCGCLQKEIAAKTRAIDIGGKVFGSLTAIETTDKRDSYGSVIWVCRCICGNIVEKGCGYLNSGEVRSCGCLKRTLYPPEAYDTPNAMRRAKYLSDTYLKILVIGKSTVLKSTDIPIELMSLKREQLKLKRLIKELS